MGGLHRGEAEEGVRRVRPPTSHLPKPPTPDHASHDLPPAGGVESGAGGVGHRPGGDRTGDGGCPGGKQGGHFPAGRTFAPEPEPGPPRKMPAAATEKNTELTLEEILLTNWEKHNRPLHPISVGTTSQDAAAGKNTE